MLVKTTEGSPQGGPLSPLLANKALKKAEKEQKAEIAQLKKEVDSGKPSVQRLLELEKKVQQQEDLQRTISSLQKTLTAIPPEIIAEYNEPKSDRKETQNHVQNI